jgi:hypothetical protein
MWLLLSMIMLMSMTVMVTFKMVLRVAAMITIDTSGGQECCGVPYEIFEEDKNFAAAAAA